MAKWIAGFCALLFLGMAVWQIFRRKDLRARYVLGPAAAALAAILAMVFLGIGRLNVDIFSGREGNQANTGAMSAWGSLLTENFSESRRSQDSGTGSQGQEQNSGASPAGDGLASEQGTQSGQGSVVGYGDYTGYLDECVQWLDYGSFVGQDYDGDGIDDRVWRENVENFSVADYRIEFGNGDRIELPMTGGQIPMVRSLDLEGDGVREILFTESLGYGTDSRIYGQMALFRKTDGGYEMLELPGGMTRVGSEERDADGTMLRYCASLPFLYEETDDQWTMRVTCPELEGIEGLEALDVNVDFTQEQWESGDFAGTCSGSGEPLTVWACQADVVPLGNGCDALELRFGMLDPWRCADEAVVALQWEVDGLRIENIRYWHEYIETDYVDINADPYPYELILRGAGYVGENWYAIHSIQVVHSYYSERFGGLVEDQIQTIDLSLAAGQYRDGQYSFGADTPGAAVSDSRDGNIRLLDLNFDGNNDFCIQAWIPEDGNIPWYCYIWNADTGQYEYGGCLPNVGVRNELRRIFCPVYENGRPAGYQSYRYEDGVMVMEQYVRRDTFSGGGFWGLDLTYVETSYSMDTADYAGNVSQILSLAERALAELYQMTGTKVESACFAVTEFGDFYFAQTEAELRKGMSFYSRCFGGEDIFAESIPRAIISDEVIGLASADSPVVHTVMPPNLERMTDEEIVQWYFEESPFAQERQWQFGHTTITAGDKVDTMEETFECNYVIRTKSGKYYELTYNRDSRTVSAYFGPYESYPTH